MAKRNRDDMQHNSYQVWNQATYQSRKRLNLIDDGRAVTYRDPRETLLKAQERLAAAVTSLRSYQDLLHARQHISGHPVRSFNDETTQQAYNYALIEYRAAVDWHQASVLSLQIHKDRATDHIKKKPPVEAGG